VTAKPSSDILIWTPTNTRPVDTRSPSRTESVSIADLALYFASREVGRNSACWMVF